MAANFLFEIPVLLSCERSGNSALEQRGGIENGMHMLFGFTHLKDKKRLGLFKKILLYFTLFYT